MSTSIIDYIFRELAVTYLGRNELAHVQPEDLEPDSVGESDAPPVDFGRGGGRLRAHRHPRPAQAQRRRPARGPGLRAEAEAPADPGRGPHRPAPAAKGHAPESREAHAAAVSEQVRVARMQGYEGDACTSCGSFTMVRNGSCLKCVSCGTTSGCS
jgi:ribonucleoside-diphosphate reductase alpha chain